MAQFRELKSETEFENFVDGGRRVVLKHSVSCPISHDLYRGISSLDSDVGLVVVQTSRALSNYISEKTGIRHESPQALVFDDGDCVYAESHYDIEPGRIKELING